MKKIFILASVCFALIFSACSERPEFIEQSGGSYSAEPADSPQGTEQEYSSAESASTPENSREESAAKEQSSGSSDDSTESKSVPDTDSSAENSRDGTSAKEQSSDTSDDSAESKSAPDTDSSAENSRDGSGAKEQSSDAPEDSAESTPSTDTDNSAAPDVPNAENKTKQKVYANSRSLKSFNENNRPYMLSLEITAAGNVNASLTAGRSGYATVIQSDYQIGEAVELSYNGGEIDEVVLHFKIADEYVQNELNLYPDVDELHGVNRFNVFKYFEEINMLLPIETTVDAETNTISSTVDELGTYCVIDMEKWFKALEDFSSMQGG